MWESRQESNLDLVFNRALVQRALAFFLNQRAMGGDRVSGCPFPPPMEQQNTHITIPVPNEQDSAFRRFKIMFHTQGSDRDTQPHPRLLYLGLLNVALTS